MRRLRLLFTILTVLFAVGISRGADSIPDSLFSYEKAELPGMKLNYRKAVHTSPDNSKNIVVLYLHGGSGQGSDNKTQMNTPAIADIYTYLQDAGFNFIFLVPQAPYGQQWMGSALPALKSLLDMYSDGGKLKTYIMGGSMGGIGTWNMLAAYPGYFTAAMPVACDTPKGSPDRYANVRVCSVAGGNDRKRNIGRIRLFFKDLNRAGGKARFDTENSWGHRQTCEWSFTPDRLAWLFSDRNND
ncbi:MAG: hypothetical protein NC043_03935 [Muribaculaceae bacterium]|nr:hypothetical protein [Muribaculaceae bacterium]